MTRRKTSEGIEWLPVDVLPALIRSLEPWEADVLVWHLGLGIEMDEIASVGQRPRRKLEADLRLATGKILGIGELQTFAGEGAPNHPGTTIVDRIADSWGRVGRCRLCGLELARAEMGRPKQFCGAKCRVAAQRMRPFAVGAGLVGMALLESDYADAVYEELVINQRPLRAAGEPLVFAGTGGSWCARAATLGNLNAYFMVASTIDDEQARMRQYDRAAVQGHSTANLLLTFLNEPERAAHLLWRLETQHLDGGHISLEQLQAVADELPLPQAIPVLDLVARISGSTDEARRLLRALEPLNAQNFNRWPHDTGFELARQLSMVGFGDLAKRWQRK